MGQPPLATPPFSPQPLSPPIGATPIGGIQPVTLPRAGGALVPALAYDGRIGELYSIFFLNLLFTVLTLGIYRFWAITRYRRYFWSHMQFQSERFEYTGTGGQLFVGFLLAGLILIGGYIVTAILAYICYQIWQPLVVLPVILAYIAIIIVAFGAVFSAQRYRVSRTLWCGIRGGMTGSMLTYGVKSLFYTLLALITFMQMWPWAQIRLTERRINATSFGNAQFAFCGRARSVYLPYLLTFIGSFVLLLVIGGVLFAVFQPYLSVLMDTDADTQMEKAQIFSRLAWVIVLAYLAFIVGVALIQCWYIALFERHVVGNTTLAGVPFRSTVSGPGLLGLIVGNLFILVFTLGLGLPIIMHRNAKFLARNVWIQGAVDRTGLTQSTLSSSPYSEGMFQQLDAGTF